MDNNELLQRLKSLTVERRESGSFFRTADECMNWIDNVAPLLRYDKNHYINFQNHAKIVRITTLSAQTIMPHLNSMIGIVNQAIIELENNITSSAKDEKGGLDLHMPDKITLKWVWEHVPAKYYWYSILVLFFVFSLGITFSRTNLYKSLSDTATAIIDTNKAMDKVK